MAASLRRFCKKRALLATALAAVLAVILGLFGLHWVFATSTAQNSASPASTGYFLLRPVGSWSSLPSDSQCASKVHYSTWEPRPENYQQNHTMPRPVLWRHHLLSTHVAEVTPTTRCGTVGCYREWTGDSTGTTDEILQWRLQMGSARQLDPRRRRGRVDLVQYLHFPGDADLGGGGGSCYWQRGCGDAFPRLRPDASYIL